jgi:4-hydroxyphenylacetate 3-monooxygenase
MARELSGIHAAVVRPRAGSGKAAKASAAGGMRSGADYISEIKNDGRSVFIDGELVRDVTTHPAFASAVRSIAAHFDLAASAEHREALTFESPDTGAPVCRTWQLPRSRADLELRHRALTLFAELSLGFMGRAPEHVSSFITGFACAPEVFGRAGAEYGERVLSAHRRLRDTHRYVTYTIVPPQIDRSKPAHQQNPPDLYAGVVKERDDGIVVKGAQMLGTGTVFSDYVLLSTIHPLRPGDENFAISVLVPCNAPGVKIYSRRSYAAAASSVFDYPLASRFDETDSLVVYDNVFVPWEDVFVYRNLEICRAQWFETPAHVLGNFQAQVRFSTKLQFLLGLAKRIADMNGSSQHLSGPLGQLATYAAMYAGLICGAEHNSVVGANGYEVPGKQEIYANMNLQSEIYPRMLDIIREICGGGLIQLPSAAADFSSPQTRQDIRTYMCANDSSAEERVKLLKLAWDAVGSEFAGRHEQYEKFYAGAPFIVRQHMVREYDFKGSARLVDYALSGYGPGGLEPADRNAVSPSRHRKREG